MTENSLVENVLPIKKIIHPCDTALEKNTLAAKHFIHISKRVSQRSKLNERLTQRINFEFLEELIGYAIETGGVHILGVGKITIKVRRERQLNLGLKHQDSKTINARKYPSIKPSKELKDMVRNGRRGRLIRVERKEEKDDN